MSAITQVVYDLLRNDAALVALLATYRRIPAVFTAAPPDSAEMPYVVTTGDVSNTPIETKDGFRREIIRDIRCYADALGDVAPIEAIADRVLKLFHKSTSISIVAPITSIVLSTASGPIVADEEDAYGRIVTVRLIIEE